MLERFISDYAEKGYEFAYKLCGNTEEAKELVQEAFFRLMRSWDRFDSTQSLENWFLTVLRNVYYDGLKRYERKHGFSIDAEVACEDEGVEAGGIADLVADGEEALIERLEREETAGAVRAALEALSPEHRAVLLLCDAEGLGYPEIASVLDCPIGTVRSRVSRARGALKKKLLEEAEVKEP